MSSGDRLYDTIGVGYASARRADPRVGSQVHEALGDARTVLNVGAGTGNYEPSDRLVIAVEPSAEMVRQRSGSVPVIRSVAEALPIGDGTFDAALAMFTIHHWGDQAAGLLELRRVSLRQVVLVYDREVSAGFWLYDYFPEILRSETERNAPTSASVGRYLDVRHVQPLLVPATCTDGFTGAFWNRPEAYLDPAVQAGTSPMARLSAAERAAGTERLRGSLDSGEWAAQYGHLRHEAWFDFGYRLVICGP